MIAEMKKKIIVTGANGQLGSEIKKISGSEPYDFKFTDVDTLDLTRKKAAFTYMDLAEPDVIVNCAAYTAVDKAETDWEKAELINKGVPEMLSEYGEGSGCRIIHISTDYVFKGNLPRPLREDDPTQPESRYGRSKVLGEQAILNYSNSMVLRTSWLYSVYGNNFVKSMIRLLNERDELKVVYDQIGTPTWAADLAAAIMTIIGADNKSITRDDKQPATGGRPDQQTGRFPNSGIFHYSNEGIASWYDFALEIKEFYGIDCKIIPIETKDYPLPAPRPAYAVLSKEKIKRQFGLEIPHWKASLKSCLKILNR